MEEVCQRQQATRENISLYVLREAELRDITQHGAV